MITNNPELLDPALVRPGRFSTRLRMDYLRLPSFLDMLGLHFGTMAKGCEDQSGISNARESVRHQTDLGKICEVVSGVTEPVDIQGDIKTFPKLSSADVLRVREAISALCSNLNCQDDEGVAGIQISPAEVESICAVSSTLDEFLENFKKISVKEMVDLEDVGGTSASA
uniref:WGS project CAEQ00000000 data, annotated contig 434 n=1 Tax=Trypanosoma congolense (strain IL3000) TaxID=1068625 RepID=F9WFX6_TRYCI|nr:unnamed protein product [Trypanosoma congolense IL3000]